MKFLLLNQTFHPDVMATGQYLTEVALGLVERGHQVTVIASRRAYDHPATQFPAKENWRGIQILRIPATGFGKGARWRRAIDFASFSLLCALRLAMSPRYDVIVALTSPPLISFLGALAAKLRGGRFVYWVMDFNPDEAIAAGWLNPGSLAASLLESMSRFSLRHAKKIIALDRFMRDRIVAKGIASEKVAVIPPWSADSVRFDPEARERFRKAHGLDGKFVVMYSGNHSPCHPLDTLLAAAKRLAADANIAFCFVGGGSEFRKIQKLISASTNASPGASELSVQAHPEGGGQFSNIVCLPYQPLDQLSGSLSAADLHVVVMGNPFVGLVHPCKIYNILSVGSPFLYIGPNSSHVTEVAESLAGERVWASRTHSDVEGVLQEISRIRSVRVNRQPGSGAGVNISQKSWLPKLIEELQTA